MFTNSEIIHLCWKFGIRRRVWYWSVLQNFRIIAIANTVQQRFRVGWVDLVGMGGTGSGQFTLPLATGRTGPAVSFPPHRVQLPRPAEAGRHLQDLIQPRRRAVNRNTQSPTNAKGNFWYRSSERTQTKITTQRHWASLTKTWSNLRGTVHGGEVAKNRAQNWPHRNKLPGSTSCSSEKSKRKWNTQAEEPKDTLSIVPWSPAASNTNWCTLTPLLKIHGHRQWR